MKVFLVSSYAPSLVNFRGHLLKNLKHRGYNVVVAAPGFSKNVKKTLLGWGVEYTKIKLRRTGTSFFSDLYSIRSLYVNIKQSKPDLVFSYTIKPVIYGSIAASWAGVPKIYSMITGLGWAFNAPASVKQRIVQFIVKKLYAHALSKNNAVIFQNPDDQKEFVEKKIVSPEITHRVYGSGVDLNHFQYSQPSVQPLSFIFIGRFVKDKGIVEFIKACNQVFIKYPDTRFHLVGWSDSNPGSLTVDKISFLDANRCITNHGKLDDVRQVLSRSSVFVLPSYREGTPRTALEAMAMGRPLIIADSPGCRETVVEGENGFMVPVKNSEALAAAMEKFIKNPDLIEPMGVKSRQMAEELYDVHKVNADLVRIMGL